MHRIWQHVTWRGGCGILPLAPARGVMTSSGARFPVMLATAEAISDDLKANRRLVEVDGLLLLHDFEPSRKAARSGPTCSTT